MHLKDLYVTMTLTLVAFASEKVRLVSLSACFKVWACVNYALEKGVCTKFVVTRKTIPFSHTFKPSFLLSVRLMFLVSNMFDSLTWVRMRFGLFVLSKLILFVSRCSHEHL